MKKVLQAYQPVFSAGLVLSIVLVGIALSIGQVDAAGCGNVSQEDPVLSNFGAAYDPLSPGKSMLFSADCTQSQAVIDVGDGKAERYIYKYVYLRNGNTWQRYELSAKAGTNRDWLVGGGRLALPLPDGDSGERYLIAYVCTKTSSGWKCGCRDGACARNYWQLFRFKRPSACVDADKDGYDTCAPGTAGDDGKPKDCLDTEIWASPVGSETCDGIDNDCSGTADEGCDDDRDGYCDLGMNIYRSNAMCPKTAYQDGRKGDDCNDNANTVNPGLSEICGNPVDENCDGSTTAGCTVVEVDRTAPIVSQFDVQPRNTTGAVDARFLATDNTRLARVELWRTSSVGASADQNAWTMVGSLTATGATLNSVLIDTPADGNWWYGLHAVDAAGNIGYEPAVINVIKRTACADIDQDTFDVCSPGQAGDDGKAIDCNDNEFWANQAGRETCDTLDNNCNGTADEGCDDDKDSYCDAAMEIYRSSQMCPGTHFDLDGQKGNDCNDANSSINPAKAEICNNGLDENCDGQVNEGCASQCADADRDGYDTCSPGLTGDDGKAADCNDTNATIAPGRDEICGNNVDENCDGQAPACPDTLAPTVESFSVTPTSLTPGSAITASYTVRDGVGLLRVELWRANYVSGSCDESQKANCSWSLASQRSISGVSSTGNFTLTPAAGVFWYGLHVVDTANNQGTESAPIKVTVRAETSGSLSLSPATISVTAGQSFSVDVMANTAGAYVTAVSAYLNFDTARLEITAIDTSASAFTVKAEESYDNTAGTVKIARGQAAPGVMSGAAFVARISFRTRSAGTAAVNYQLSSAGSGPSRLVIGDGSGTDILRSAVGGSYTIGASDTSAPAISTFTVSPTTLTQGGTITASYIVTDNALARVELWRALFVSGSCDDTQKANCSWVMMQTRNISGTSNTGYFNENPTQGIFWYGIHAVDTAGNIGNERTSVKVAVNAPVQACTPNGCNGICPAGCTVSADPDCGCSAGNVCCGLGCVAGSDSDCTPADIDAPFVSTFTISPATLTQGSAITASYAISDDTDLLMVELWRTTDSSGLPNASGWSRVAERAVSGRTASGALTDTPPAGTYWYGIHAIDSSFNTGRENTQIRVTVNSTSSTCAPNGCNGNCPVGCTVVQDPDCGCVSGNSCCGIGCAPASDGDCTSASDTTTPSITSFSVSPSALSQGGTLTASYSVADNALARVELWRTSDSGGVPNASGWIEVARRTVSGTANSGTLADVPAPGTYWYGIHAVDTSGNIGREGTQARATVAAGSNPTLFVSPAAFSVITGQTFTLDILANTGGRAVTAVSAYLTFSSNYLEVVSIDGNSPLTIQAESVYDNSAGTIRIARGQMAPGVTGGSVLVSRITFRARSAAISAVNFQFLAAGQGPSKIILGDGTGTDILSAVVNGNCTAR